MGWISDLSVMRSMERAWQTVIASWCAVFLPLHVMMSSVAYEMTRLLVRTACAFGAGLAQSADTKKPRRSFERRGEVDQAGLDWIACPINLSHPQADSIIRIEEIANGNPEIGMRGESITAINVG